MLPTPPSIEEAAALLNKADKVAIFAGAGVEGAHDEVIALADALKAPIGHSLRGKHFIQYDNPFDVGMTGLLGYGAAAEGMNDADVLILLGTDFPYDQFLPSTPNDPGGHARREAGPPHGRRPRDPRAGQALHRGPAPPTCAPAARIPS